MKNLTFCTLTTSLLTLLSVASVGSAQTPTNTTVTSTGKGDSASSGGWSNSQDSQREAARLANETRILIDQARRSYPAGSANIDQALWKKAAAAIEGAVKLAPNNPDHLRLRAQLYTETGFWKRAEETWNDFFKVSPQGPAGGLEWRAAALAQYNLGYAAYQNKQLNVAKSYFQSCLKLDNKNLDCLNWAGRTALEQGDYQQARNFYRQAVQVNPQDRALRYFVQITDKGASYGAAATRSFAQAYGHLDAGRKKEALQGFLQAGQIAPSFIEAWREAGRLALDLNDVTSASRAYQAIMSLANTSKADKYNYRFVQEAEKYGLQAVKTFRDAYGEYSKGNKDKALQGFEQATRLSNNYAKAWAWIGRSHYEKRNFAEAANAYQKAVDLDPADKSSLHFLKMSRKEIRDSQQ